MGRNGSSKAARDQRKRKKAQRRDARKARQATRPSSATSPWVPLREGIAGWARRQSVDYWEAARAVSERPGVPPEVWTLPRVAALSSEALLAGLAERGVSTDEVSFRALGERYRSCSALLREGIEAPAQPTALDLDFLELATRVLYGRWVSRWRCVEDLADLWVDDLRRPADAGDALAGAVRLAEAFAPHLTAPGLALAEAIYDSAPLMGWFLTLVEGSEARAEEDPAGALPTLPGLELLAEHFEGEPTDRLDVLRALGAVLLANGQDAAGRLLDWSARRSLAEGAVALTEVRRAYEAETPPEVRKEGVALLRMIAEKGWTAHEDLLIDERIADLERPAGT